MISKVKVVLGITAIGALATLTVPALCQNSNNSVEKAPVTAPVTLHVSANVTDERVNVRTGPGGDFKRIALVDKGTSVTITARDGDWVQATLADGKSGWIGFKYVESAQAIPAEKLLPVTPKATTTKEIVQPQKVQQPAAANQNLTKTLQSSAAAAKPAPSHPAPQEATGKKAGEVEKDVIGVLSNTRPDILGGAKDTPAASAGDSFRVILVLLPVLGLIVLAIRGLKSVQTKTGTLPDLRKGLRSSIIGGFNLANARKSGGSTIRVVESIPVGSAGLHLVEVRGRTLLLGATANSLNMLLELTENQSGQVDGDSDFKTLLNNMTGDLHEDYADAGGYGSLGTMVGSLEDQIREARESIAQSAVRARSAQSQTWKESNDEDASYRR